MIKRKKRARWSIRCKLASLGLALLTLTGCGYSAVHGKDDQRVSLSIPYFSGDYEGELTQAVVRACAHSFAFDYTSSSEGRWTLIGAICTDEVEDIGFTYDLTGNSNPLEKRQNPLIANEGKRKVKVKVSLVDSLSGKVVYGPFFVDASVCFDFINPDFRKDVLFGSTETIAFSLGQLDSRFGAQQAAAGKAYRGIAEQIFRGFETLLAREEEAHKKMTTAGVQKKTR